MLLFLNMCSFETAVDTSQAALIQKLSKVEIYMDKGRQLVTQVRMHMIFDLFLL